MRCNTLSAFSNRFDRNDPPRQRELDPDFLAKFVVYAKERR